MPDFYKQIGKDPKKLVHEGIQAIRERYNLNDDLELGIDWEYESDGTHNPLTKKAKRRTQ